MPLDTFANPPSPRVKPRYSLLTLLAIGGVVALGVGWLASGRRWSEERAHYLSLLAERQRIPSMGVMKKLPMTFVIDHRGDSPSSVWNLSVNSGGAAILDTGLFDGKREGAFHFTSEQWADIREVIASERFFELDDPYGHLVPDGSSQTLTIVIGGYSKTVALNYLPWDPTNPNYNSASLQEAARALRVYLAIRDCFPASAVSDERPYLQRAIRAAHKLRPTEAKQQASRHCIPLNQPECHARPPG